VTADDFRRRYDHLFYLNRRTTFPQDYALYRLGRL